MNGKNKSIICDTKGDRFETYTKHSSYKFQGDGDTKQPKVPATTPTITTQEQGGGRPTYLKRSSVDYKDESMHFAHFIGPAPNTNPYKSYNGTGKMLGHKENYQGGLQNMMPTKILPQGQTEWKVKWI